MWVRAMSEICPIQRWCSTEVCRAGDAERTRALMQRAGRVVCRNLGQVAMARELGTTFDVAAPVFCANRATLTWLRGLGAGRVCLSAELLGNDAERVAELAACPGVLGLSMPTVPSSWCASTAC